MSEMIYVEVSSKRFGTPDWKHEFIYIESSALDSVHQRMSEERPYFYINFRWGKGESFILGAPHQMFLDEDVLSDQEYLEKWYLV